jgi:hypothetical protein
LTGESKYWEEIACSERQSQPNMRILTFFILGFASIVLADDFKTIAGKEYKNVTVRRVEPDGIVLNTDSGISKVYFTDLPKEVQERFHYDEAKAAAYSRDKRHCKLATLSFSDRRTTCCCELAREKSERTVASKIR